jgi:putative ABC transport system permease protein
VSKTNVNDSLKESGRSAGAAIHARRWGNGFIIAQIALTLVLLTGGGLMFRSFVSLYRADRIIDTSGVITARLSLPAHTYPTSEARARFFESLSERLADVPMLMDFALASTIPFGEGSATRQISLEGTAGLPGGELPTVSYVSVSERYFNTLGVRLVRGRPFRTEDSLSGGEGAIVNQRFVTMLLPGGDVVGRRIRLADRNRSNESAPFLTIVGVAATIPQSVASDKPDRPTVYVPLLATLPPVVSVIVRSRSDAAEVVSRLREEVRRLDPNLPLYYVQTLEQAFADARSALRIVGVWFGALAVIALLLATVGVYAVTGHAVGQRTREIGVRVALGAERHQIVWLFLRRALVQITVGVVIGIAGALAVGRLLETWLTGTHPRDPITLVLVTVLLITVAIAATLVPARRAMRIDPIVALRYE